MVFLYQVYRVTFFKRREHVRIPDGFENQSVFLFSK